MVNTKSNGVRHIAHVNALAEEYTARGHSREVLGRGRVAPTRDGVIVENSPKNEAPPVHYEKD